MEAVVDKMGRVVIPKALRDSLGLSPGTHVDISTYGEGLQIVRGGRTARLSRSASGRLVAGGDVEIDDETLMALIDAGRR
ncbi:AbrB/MazE/SpoVT family DNA-binding domain-containing protein [Ornithinimicrobium tianjinense]|uniref:Antitoxin VapB27 n=1 Tax=Ornithinimicrobium tianjinense TaxID=1195761 RepID=A0A917BJH8_9MICO|nr:AbrB/MazE/SpoVT family DNA-binding domain-containing protein [Ornithinimicrobium tianjinense]GGF43402.1 antitoxin VapB27 [Ornithinimicrobium tianjinense]